MRARALRALARAASGGGRAGSRMGRGLLCAAPRRAAPAVAQPCTPRAPALMPPLAAASRLAVRSAFLKRTNASLKRELETYLSPTKK